MGWKLSGAWAPLHAMLWTPLLCAQRSWGTPSAPTSHCTQSPWSGRGRKGYIWERGISRGRRPQASASQRNEKPRMEVRPQPTMKQQPHLCWRIRAHSPPSWGSRLYMYK
jgi:hypothetical protein